MARTVLPIAGAIIGAFYGNPYAGYAIGAAIAGVVDPINTKGPRIGETGAQTSQEGAPRGIVYGTCQVTGNVIASGPLIKRDVKESQGKGGGSVSTEHAYRTYAVRICEGPIQAVLRVWQDDKLVYDIRSSSTMELDSAKWAENKVFYFGDEDQLPDPSLQMIFGTEEVPAHRGSAYFVAIEDDLTDRRGSIPQYRFEVSGTASLTTTLNPLIVYPWVEGSVHPIDERNEHTFQYAGFEGNSGSPQLGASGPSRTSESLALADMIAGWNADTAVSTPPAVDDMVPIGWADANGVFFPADAIAGNEQQTLRLHFNEILPNSYTPIADFPLANSLVPDLQTGTKWGAQSPRSSVWYRATPSAASTNWVDPDRRYSTETFTNVEFDGLELFSTYDGVLACSRVPVPPEGFTKVVGTAKQLAIVEYRAGDLYQNGLGPVILPEDPRYADEDFWDAERDAAIAAGTLEADVSSPVVVSEYATGYVVGVGLPVPLSGIVSDIHDRCDFPAGKFDVSELTDEVSGLVLAGDYTGADAINTLRSLYLFDAADQDKNLVYPKRGKPVVAAITEDDIVEAEESSKREQAIEYPKKLHLSYQNAVGGYAVAKATSARSSPDVRVVGEVSTSVPVVLSPDQAAQTAAKMHKIAWAEAEGETKLSVPLSWIKYIASDCFGVALRGRVTRERLDELNYADGVIEMTLRRDRQSAYTSSVTGIPIPEPTPPPSTIVGETVLAVLDISPRADNEDDLNLLYAVSGGLPAWNGATVQRSLDGGANYTSVVDINRGPVLGTLATDLADASEFYTDRTNVLRVQLYRDTQTIESITDAQFLSEGGGFAVQRPDGSWEVMQYRDADEVSPGVFDLSYLHRGQLNSGTSEHLAGSLFVMLADAVKVPAQSAWIGTDLTHRAVSYGESPETADEQTETYVGRSQIEWPVAYLTLARDGSDNVSGTWTPRHRFGTEDSPVESVNFRGYRVTLDDGVLPAFTFDTTAPTFTYDASALGTPLTVTVSAINRITGAGPSTSGAI